MLIVTICTLYSLLLTYAALHISSSQKIIFPFQYHSLIQTIPIPDYYNSNNTIIKTTMHYIELTTTFTQPHLKTCNNKPSDQICKKKLHPVLDIYSNQLLSCRFFVALSMNQSHYRCCCLPIQSQPYQSELRFMSEFTNNKCKCLFKLVALIDSTYLLYPNDNG